MIYQTSLSLEELKDRLIKTIFLMFNLLISFSGYIIGLGAVTVIDTLGFLGRKSSYWAGQQSEPIRLLNLLFG